jgi:hypothetical protein
LRRVSIRFLKNLEAHKGTKTLRKGFPRKVAKAQRKITFNLTTRRRETKYKASRNGGFFSVILHIQKFPQSHQATEKRISRQAAKAQRKNPEMEDF